MKAFGTILNGALVIRVLLAAVSESDGHLEENDEGAYDSQGGRIFLSSRWLEGADPSRVRATMLHEVVHAWLEASGVRQKLRTMLGVSNPRWDEIEEDLVNMLSPLVSSSLPSLAKVLAPGNIRRVMGGS